MESAGHKSSVSSKGLIAFSSATALLPYGAVLPKSVSILPVCVLYERGQSMSWLSGSHDCAGETATKCAAKVRL